MHSKVTGSGDSADVRLKVPQRVHTAVVAKDHVWRGVYRDSNFVSKSPNMKQAERP
jgi:hypothetical protein